jgi:hypothetical protein
MSFEFLKKNKTDRRFHIFSLLIAIVAIMEGCHQSGDIKSAATNQMLCEQNAQDIFQKYPRNSILIIGRVDLSHNTPTEILEEVKDTVILQLLCESSSIRFSEIEKASIFYNSNEQEFEIYWPEQDDVFNVSGKIGDYIKSRFEGHTPEYTFASMKTKYKTQSVSDPNLKKLLKERPELPASWLKKTDWKEESWQDASGDSYRSCSYMLVDGDIAWFYTLTYSANGTFKCLTEEKSDAKEYDPKYKAMINEVNRRVGEEMKRKGIKGLGSCHTFWELKKEHLKDKGIDWKSPSELNPETMYD